MKRLRRLLRRLVLALLVIVVALPLVYLAVFRFVPIPGTPLMVIRLFEGAGWSRDWEPLAAISPNLVRAVIASEDARFCAHWGFDFREMKNAVADWIDGERLRGASTISQQTAKNLFLWPGGGGVRKVIEAWPTVAMEALWPKRRILEAYLNVAEWDAGVYGAEAAARHHFGKPARSLSLREAALLAAVLPNPRLYSASRPTAHISRRAAVIRARMQGVRLGGGDRICP